MLIIDSIGEVHKAHADVFFILEIVFTVIFQEAGNREDIPTREIS